MDGSVLIVVGVLKDYIKMRRNKSGKICRPL